MSNEELLDAYFDGSLSGEEKVDFEQRLQQDPSLKEEFEFRKALRQSLRKNEHQQIKEMFAEESATITPRQYTIRRFIPALIAASILLIATLGYFLVAEPDAPENNDLFIAYFEPYENVIHPIERGNPMEDLRSRAFYAYENQEYEEAIELFRQLAELQPDPYIDFYSGIVFLQLDQNKEAIDRFILYLASEGKLKDRATWYLALGYLKNDEKDMAEKILREIVSGNKYKAKEAEELIELLN